MCGSAPRSGCWKFALMNSPSLIVLSFVFSFLFLLRLSLTMTTTRCRYRKQKKQQKVQRCHKNAASPFDVPVALRGGPDESGALVDDAVLYDELLSYAPTHFRSNHSIPPAYEVIFRPLTCSWLYVLIAMTLSLVPFSLNLFARLR